MDKKRLYYTQMFFDTILPQIQEITTQSRYGYHGISHTIQVALFGIDLAQHINQDAIPVMLAAGLHDCARTNDAWCVEHGPHAAIVGREFLAKKWPQLPQKTVQQIIYAVENHTTGDNAPDGISACLWDGDRIRLSWEYGYAPRFFSTQRGREIASLDRRGQDNYIAQQDKFLIDNKIKTAQELKYERQQDILQNNTKFKTC